MAAQALLCAIKECFALAAYGPLRPPTDFMAGHGHPTVITWMLKLLSHASQNPSCAIHAPDTLFGGTDCITPGSRLGAIYKPNLWRAVQLIRCSVIHDTAHKRDTAGLKSPYILQLTSLMCNSRHLDSGQRLAQSAPLLVIAWRKSTNWINHTS